MSINGKIAVVTGAGGVLCSHFAKCLAENGARVMLLDINEESIKNLSDEINKNGGISDYFACSVLDKDSLESVRAKIVDKYGKCDILINGAGGNHPRCTLAHEYYENGEEEKDDIKTFFNLDKADFGFVFDLNLVGTLLPSQVFIKDMLNREGVVINVSSMNAFKPLTKIPAYSSAKSGVSNLTEWLSVHFASAGVRVNAIAPGFFVTNQNKALLFDENGNPTKRTEKILNATPMGRFGKPEELLGTLLWLVDNEKSSFVTGTVIPVDGGFNAYSGV